MKTWTGWILVLAISVVSPAIIAGQAKETPAKGAKTGIDITFGSRPAPPKTGENEFDVTVKRNGTAVADADVAVVFVMPAMPAMKMAEMRNETRLKAVGGGKYTGSGQVHMAGMWNVTITVKQNGKKIGQKNLTVTAE